jgi:excisionase family DNA binding protein
MPSEDKILTFKEVVAYFKIPKSTLYKLCERKTIPFFKLGKQLRFRQSSLEQWLNKEEQKLQGQTAPALFKREKAQALLEPVASPATAKQILLVDDEPIVLQSITKLLTNHGYQVEACQNPLEALEKAAQKQFDLLITDIKMPQLNGIETIKRIRQLQQQSQRPLPREVIITGYLDSLAEQEAENLGISDYLYKPFSIAEFMEAVAKKLELPPGLN